MWFFSSVFMCPGFQCNRVGAMRLGQFGIVPSTIKHMAGKSDVTRTERDSAIELFNAEWHATWKAPNPNVAS